MENKKRKIEKKRGDTGTGRGNRTKTERAETVKQEQNKGKRIKDEPSCGGRRGRQDCLSQTKLRTWPSNQVCPEKRQTLVRLRMYVCTWYVLSLIHI